MPPLKTLRFFESVARHLSFSKAGQELFVTQSAVSYQIRCLEEFLEKQLFIRQGKRLNLTDTGALYYTTVQRILASLNGVTAKIKGHISGSTRFLVYSSFALKWVVPKLSDFRIKFPEIDLRLEMNSDSDANLEVKQADCGITYERNNENYEYVHLIDEEMVIVCSPNLFTNDHLDIENIPLLISDDINEWVNVYDRLNLKLPEKQYYYSHAIFLLQAAIEGQGLALCAESFVKSDISSGLLKKVELALEEKIITRFYFCVEKGRLNEPSIRSLLDWLRNEFR